VNARGGLLGRKIQLKFVDDASSTQQVVTNYQNLISRDRVDLTFGPFSSLLTIPASEIASRHGYAFPEPAGWWSNAKTPQNDHFVKAFLAKFGGGAADISADAAEAYSVGRVVEQAANRINSIDNAKLIKALHSGTYQTIQGPMAFDKTGQPNGASFLVQWQNGQTVPVYPTSVARSRSRPSRARSGP
jgi:ABC-type branched-subunit amino acid transport system substrate-binding protein